MKPVRFHPEAESETIEAAVWYETQQEDLGKRFLTSLQDAVNKIELTSPGDVSLHFTLSFANRCTFSSDIFIVTHLLSHRPLGVNRILPHCQM